MGQPEGDQPEGDQPEAGQPEAGPPEAPVDGYAELWTSVGHTAATISAC